MALRKDEVREFRARFYALAFLAFLAFVVVAVRLYTLQVKRGEDYQQQSEKNFVQKLRLIADRGLIYDAKGRLLVDNRPALDLVVTPAFVQGLREARKGKGGIPESVMQVAEYLEMSPKDMQDLFDRLRKAQKLELFQAQLVRRDLERDQLELIEHDRMLGKLSGFSIQPSGLRDYRYGPLLAHATGYLNEIGPEELQQKRDKGETSYELGDLLGRRGAERAFEHVLRGTDGYERIVVDSKSRKQPEALSRELLGDDRRVPSSPGKNLIMSIDLDLQQTAEASFTGKAGAVIAVEVDTGFVVAYYSTPAYDPNRVTGRLAIKEKEKLDSDPLQPWVNRGIQAHYPPGSTYKAFTALTALDKGLLTPETFMPCPGYYKYGGNTWRCFKDSGHGGLQLHKSLVYSCDAYYYALGAKMGIEPLAATARLFGFGRRTGIALADGEIPGIVPDVEYHNWAQRKEGGYKTSYAINTSVGQGANAFTPLQLVMAYAAIANGGTLYEPQIVRRIEDADGKVIQAFEPKVVSKIPFKQEHYEAVREGLCGVVNEPGGTAFGKAPPGLQVCGKTGTAQVAKMKKRTGGTAGVLQIDYALRDHAWFVGFAPGEAPKYAIVTFTEHGGFGGASSAPPVIKTLRAAILGEILHKTETAKTNE